MFATTFHLVSMTWPLVRNDKCMIDAKVALLCFTLNAAFIILLQLNFRGLDHSSLLISGV